MVAAVVDMEEVAVDMEEAVVDMEAVAEDVAVVDMVAVAIKHRTVSLLQKFTPRSNPTTAPSPSQQQLILIMVETGLSQHF